MANSLRFSCKGRVGFIDWLDVFSRPVWESHSDNGKDNNNAQDNENVAGGEEATEIGESNSPTFVALDTQVSIRDQRVNCH